MLDKAQQISYNKDVNKNKHYLIKKGIDTMKEKKITKREYFNTLLTLEEVKANADLVAFINHELELLDRKNANGEKKMTATQITNESIKKQLVEEMEDNRLYTISEMLKVLPCCAELSNQKVTRLVSDLVKDNKLIRTEDKRKAYFSKA